MAENTNKSPKQDQRQSGESIKPQKPEGAESTVGNPGSADKDSGKPDKLRQNNASEELEDEGEILDLDDLEEDDDDEEDTITR
jgi:hypothetical protein